MKRLMSALFAASVLLAVPLAAQAAPVAHGASQAASEAPMIEKAHSDRWRYIARSGQRFGGGGYRGRGGYGGGYGRGYGRPYGRPYGYGRPHGYGYGRGW
jgi:hypothetical protein